MTEGTSGIFLQSSRKRSACRLHCLEAVEVVMGVVMWGSPPPQITWAAVFSHRETRTLPVSSPIWFSHQAKPRSSERDGAHPGDAKM